MLELLRDPAWQGIAGIIAIISLILFIYSEREKLIKPFNIDKQRLITRVLIALLGSSGAFLGLGAFLTLDAFITRYGQVWGSLIASIALNLGLYIWFVFLVRYTFGNRMDKFENFLIPFSSIMIFNTFIMWGIASANDTIELPITKLLMYGMGSFTVGSGLIVSILKSLKSDTPPIANVVKKPKRA